MAAKPHIFHTQDVVNQFPICKWLTHAHALHKPEYGVS